MTGPGPLRRVSRPHLHSGGSILAPFKYRWWELDLECGHSVERRCRYRHEPNGARGYGAQHRPPSMERLFPAPERARCEVCAREVSPS